MLSMRLSWWWTIYHYIHKCFLNWERNCVPGVGKFTYDLKSGQTRIMIIKNLVKQKLSPTKSMELVYIYVSFWWGCVHNYQKAYSTTSYLRNVLCHHSIMLKFFVLVSVLRKKGWFKKRLVQNKMLGSWIWGRKRCKKNSFVYESFK